MKKKWSFIIFMAVFLLAVGAFHYDGTQSKKTATQEQEDELIEINDDAISESTEVEQAEGDGLENPVDVIKDDEIQPVTSKEGTTEPIKGVDKESKQETVTAEKNTSKEEEIIIDGTLYTLTMDEEKYSNLLRLIIPAKNHGAKLYAAYREDFVIVKDGKPLAYIFLGEIRASVQHVGLLKDLLTDEGYNLGIKDNIDFVVKTGATVSVKWDDHSGYEIRIKDDWLTVFYM
ncbi:hypothetical protein [Bacillus sp. FJAT-50079]|uniref:hypothetical protein n=1 Tax=Bacillus sp. FJAT-50079 TaxID=2833577 RepID=UPI001BC984B6|nr:hypothetical protein [Bacillus sp. FJAT-50079]MBS4207497.1 hypothetical protein [Bacillus sp. FJAT-50079]